MLPLPDGQDLLSNHFPCVVVRHYAEEVHPITPTSSGVVQGIAFTLPVYEVKELGGGFCVTQRPVMVLQ